MDKNRLVSIFGQNLLADAMHEHSFRELTGLAGQKPWECVGEILEAAACLYALTKRSDWAGDSVVHLLEGDLLAQYGATALEAAMTELMTDAAEHLIPNDVQRRIAVDAV